VTTTAEPELAEAHLLGLLASLGLDVDYVRGEGNTIHFRGPDGVEVPVLDLVGGYGSLIFGHNHPVLVARARQLLADNVAVHAQFSRHPYANELAARLNRILHREFGVDEPYVAVFSNTGAEAVETAMKHAELDRVIELGGAAAEVAGHLAAARDHRGPVADAAYALAGVDAGRAERLLEQVARHNDAVLARPPVFLALEGSFHGKLAGSVQLTHNPGYREPFRTLAAQARFVPARPGAMQAAVRAERAVLLDPVVTDAGLELRERPVRTVAAMFVEPIQGEGGIHVLDPAVAAEIRAAADAGGFPVVADEIQTGFGRTGTFFAGAPLGLLGDYVVLAKALGGGIAKSAVLLVRRDRYRPDFELVHSSTFAKDAFSGHLGLAVLDLLEADDGAAYRTAAERGAALSAALEAVRADFGDVLADVRGRGLMVGLEFRDLTGSASAVLSDNARAGLIGYVLAGFLLREHRIRVFPTASAPHTIRVQPSILLTDQEIARFAGALRELCGLLRQADGDRLMP
jgi:acetylornithine/succinyldiaminopimelate/putrescine aminotransferase